MTKIYTRTGDQGQTGLFGGQRLRKDQIRMAVCGTVDELNAAVGVARSECSSAAAPAADDDARLEIDRFLGRVQHQLFSLGAELATPAADQHGTQLLPADEVGRLEAAIDAWEVRLSPLREFILPGGCRCAAQLHLARCVCRRAERLVVALAADEPVRGLVLQYINRLGDALFVLARYANRAAGLPDVVWQREI